MSVDFIMQYSKNCGNYCFCLGYFVTFDWTKAFPACDDFCRLLITFANSLDPDLLDTLIVFLKEFFEKFHFEKNQQATKKKITRQCLD